MSELIKREDAVKATWHEPSYTDAYNVLTEVRDRIEALPTVDAVPVRHGEWMRTDAFPHRVYCSCCYKTYVPNENWQIWQDDADNFGLPRNYCPNCGARMKTVTDCHTLEEGER